jgi:hypothetical protein
LLPAAIVAALAIVLLIAAIVVSTSLLLQAAVALQTGHCHSAGNPANKILHIGGASAHESLPPVVRLKALRGIGDPHSGKTPLTAVRPHKITRATGDAAADRAAAKHSTGGASHPRRANAAGAKTAIAHSARSEAAGTSAA